MRVFDTLFGAESEILSDQDMVLLLFASIMGPLGSGIVSPILESLIGPFGTSPANIGLMIAAVTGPSVLLIPVMGILADRFGRKPILVVSLLLFGTAGSAVALTTSFHTALFLRVIQGVGFAGINPIIITCIGDLYTGEREATAQGFRFTVAGLSSILFPLVAGVLVVMAWQYPFLLYGIAVPIAVLVYLRFEETIDSGGQNGDTRTTTHVKQVLEFLYRKHILAILVARGLMPVTWFAFLTYNSIIVVRLLDGTPAQAGILVAITSLGLAGTATQAGRITGLFADRFRPVLAGNTCLGVGFTVVAFAPSVALTAIGCAIGGIGLGILGPLYRSIITGLPPETLRAGLVSVGESLSRVAATLTPIVMGFLIVSLTPLLGFAGAVRWIMFGTVTASSLVSILTAQYFFMIGE